ncbi:MAG TPA: protein kinase, partial [Phormidium sp.]
KHLQDRLKAIQKIQSKHVLQIYDLFIIEKKQEVYVGAVEEFIPGDDLTHLIGEEQNLDWYLRILFQLATGISDIHKQGIVHRNIKPSNIKIDPEGLIRILNFNLACSEGKNIENKKLYESNVVSIYDAPELRYSLTNCYKQALDTYAFGITAAILADKSLSYEGQADESWVPVFDHATFDLPQEVHELLITTVAIDPEQRPLMQDVCELLGKYLLQDKHIGIIFDEDRTHIIDASSRTVRLSYPSVGSLDISYDGLRFAVRNVEGQVYINNDKVTFGTYLPGSCVITFGDPDKGSRRHFARFDMSNPEVVL